MFTNTQTAGEVSLAEDLLRGVGAIASYIGEDPKRTYYLLAQRYLPAGKVGSTWTASKKRLKEHFERLTQGEPPQLPRHPRISRRRPAKTRRERRHARPRGAEAAV